jgi:amidase
MVRLRVPSALVPDELTWLDAVAQADLVRRGEASPRDLVDAAIRRIERVNPMLNAVIHTRFEKARAEASGELPAGPFRGVPVLLKDLTVRSVGDPYHAGSRFLKGLGYVAAHDSYLTARFRRAGFVIVGRTNTPELGSTITTEPVAYGAAHNPWNLEHSTGGSSGGSAAAVAAGMTAVAHANDGGGSIRIPASECGLVGLKPSRGRVSQGPAVGESWMGATVDGVVTRTVRDTAAVLDCLAGYEPGDPYTAPPPARPFADEVGADPGRLRVGLLDHPLRDGIEGHPACAAAVDLAGRLLERLGHAVEIGWPSALDDPAFSHHFATIVSVATAADLAEWEAEIGRPLTDEDVEVANLRAAERGRSVAAAGYVASERWLHGYTRRVTAWWHGRSAFDVLVSPVIATPPPRLGWLSDPEHGMRRVAAMLQYTSQFNITGQPAISLPLHWTADGLPVGVQLVAAYGREDLLLRVAAQLEQVQPWAGRRPPLDR